MSGPLGVDRMDLKELKKLVSLMNENGLVELEICEDGRKCVLKKANPAQMTAMPTFAMAPPAQMGGGVGPGLATKSNTPAPPAEDTVTFNSPIVGTFYRSSSPDAPSFVKAGDKINPDTVLCLIEAMKVFSEIKAEMNGTVIDVLVENQEAVEFNQPLFLIKR